MCRHGFFTEKKKVSATSIFFESLPYKVNEKTGYLDYSALSKSAKLFKPKIIIAGASVHSTGTLFHFFMCRYQLLLTPLGLCALPSDLRRCRRRSARRHGTHRWPRGSWCDWLPCCQWNKPLLRAGVVPSPFEYADVVMTTAHKSLRGPRCAMIFYRYV